jgi:drug/metabolite transporter (DMT)-like permease
MTAFFTLLALLAFAANSVLCRLALGGGAIDPASFTTIRLVSGAAALLALAAVSPGGRTQVTPPGWRSALALAAYAIAFSFAYTSLTVGTGALILFGAVQTTMIATGLAGGERPTVREWVGLAAAIGGLVYLVSPGFDAPSAAGSALMAAAGVSWGAYSLWGRGAGDPVAATRINFVRAAPLTIAISAAGLSRAGGSAMGILLAVVSGALTSGLGYVAWYAAIAGLTATRAATVQLAVPVLAATAGVVFLAEAMTVRLGLSAILILSGIALAVMSPAVGDPHARLRR